MKALVLIFLLTSSMGFAQVNNPSYQRRIFVDGTTVFGAGTSSSPLSAAQSPVTASNGLTTSVADVRLGGTLTSATLINTGVSTNGLIFNTTGAVFASSFSVGRSFVYPTFTTVNNNGWAYGLENGTTSVGAVYIGSALTNGGTNFVGYGNRGAASTCIFTNNICGLTMSSAQNVGFGTATPSNRLHIATAAVANTAGIRTPLTSASSVGTSTAYLAVDTNGDVVRGAAITLPNYTSIQNNSTTLTLGAKQITYRNSPSAAAVSLPACTLGNWITFIEENTAVITYSAVVRNNGVGSTTYTGPFKHQLVCANSGFWTVIN